MFVCAELARCAPRRRSRDANLRLLQRRAFTIELSAGSGFFDGAHLPAAAFGRWTDKKGVSRDRHHNPFLRQSMGRAPDLLWPPQELRVF